MKNYCYPEGSISERYVLNEATTYCNLYLGGRDESRAGTNAMEELSYDISVVSSLVRPHGEIMRERLGEPMIAEAHWQVLTNCKEVEFYLTSHENLYSEAYPEYEEWDRRRDFLSYFYPWVRTTVMFH